MILRIKTKMIKIRIKLSNVKPSTRNSLKWKRYTRDSLRIRKESLSKVTQIQ